MQQVGAVLPVLRARHSDRQSYMRRAVLLEGLATLSGHMRAESLEAELPNFRFRHLAKPGLSGWAQVNYGYGANVEDARIKLSYDLYYLKHASIDIDLLLFLRTFGAMMRGAR